MTFVGDEDDGSFPKLMFRIMENNHGNYVKLSDSEAQQLQGHHTHTHREDDHEEEQGGREEDLPQPHQASSSPMKLEGSARRGSLFWWLKWVVLSLFSVSLAVVFFKWIGPFFMEKVIFPVINWEMTRFSTPVLAVVIFLSVALFPTLLLPSSPSMWLAGITFGYGFGFLLILSAAAVGVSLPYFIGSLFYHKIEYWLDKYPEKASVLRSAGEGNWFHQFQAVALIRISPFPYVIYNYCAVATDVKYGPYIFGSLAGMVPEIFVAIYTGILIRALADASHEKHSLSAPQIIFNILGFCATVATTIIITLYAKRKLKVLQKEEELLMG